MVCIASKRQATYVLLNSRSLPCRAAAGLGESVRVHRAGRAGAVGRSRPACLVGSVRIHSLLAMRAREAAMSILKSKTRKVQKVATL